MNSRVRLYHATTRWLIANGYLREVAPDYDRAVSNVVAKIGARTRTQEKITLGRIGRAIDKIKPEIPLTVDTAVETITGNILTHSEIVAPMAAKETAKGTAKFYTGVKEGWGKELDIPVTWSAADTEAQRLISAWDKTFIGNHYDDKVTRQAERIIRKTIADAEGAMSRRELAARLKTEMRGVVRPAHYWETVAAQNINTARSWSAAKFFQEADIDRYEVITIPDARRSEICEYMDGKILEVEHTLETFEKYKTAETAEDVKNVSPWLTSSKDEEGDVGIFAGGQRLTPELSGEDLQALGVDAPPYHGKCRTTVGAVL